MTDNDKTPSRQDQRRRTNASLGSVAILLIVATIVYLAVNGRESDASNSDRNGGSLESTVVLSGIERRITSPAFHHAEFSAILGGIDLDFSEAAMEGNEARIDVSAILGGVDIRVPREWTVENRVKAILGGVDDHTRPTDGGKRLIIEGTVLLGGLDIKN